MLCTVEHSGKSLRINLVRFNGDSVRVSGVPHHGMARALPPPHPRAQANESRM